MTVKEVSKAESQVEMNHSPGNDEPSDGVSGNIPDEQLDKNSCSEKMKDMIIIGSIVRFFTTGYVMKFRNACKTLVNNNTFRLIIIVLIFINALMMGVATYDFGPTAEKVLEDFDKGFLWLFTVELVVQFFAFLFRLFLDGWLVFDFLVIVISWTSQGPLTVFRAFRILRALRLITRVKTMKQLVTAIFSVLPSMAAILLLLLLIFYIFAVMFTQLYGDTNDASEQYFSDLFFSLFTLFQIMTFDGWGGVTREIGREFISAYIFILIFLMITGFIVLNLIIAVICEAVSNAEDDVKDGLHGSFNEDEDDVDSEETMKQVRERIFAVGEQLDTLEQIQERNIHTLEYLAKQLRQRKG